jgi:hypothetical protein
VREEVFELLVTELPLRRHWSVCRDVKLIHIGWSKQLVYGCDVSPIPHLFIHAADNGLVVFG